MTLTMDEEITHAITYFEAKHARPLTERERSLVHQMGDDPWGHIYDPVPGPPQPTDWSGNGYLNEYD